MDFHHNGLTTIMFSKMNLILKISLNQFQKQNYNHLSDTLTELVKLKKILKVRIDKCNFPKEDKLLIQNQIMKSTTYKIIATS